MVHVQFPMQKDGRNDGHDDYTLLNKVFASLYNSNAID